MAKALVSLDGRTMNNTIFRSHCGVFGSSGINLKVCSSRGEPHPGRLSSAFAAVSRFRRNIIAEEESA